MCPAVSPGDCRETRPHSATQTLGAAAATTAHQLTDRGGRRQGHTGRGFRPRGTGAAGRRGLEDRGTQPGTEDHSGPGPLAECAEQAAHRDRKQTHGLRGGAGAGCGGACGASTPEAEGGCLSPGLRDQPGQRSREIPSQKQKTNTRYLVSFWVMNML